MRDFLKEARELSAQCWCKPATENNIMNVALAEEFAKLLAVYLEKLDKADKDLEWLACLEAAGVDNWQGIEEAQRMFKEETND